MHARIGEILAGLSVQKIKRGASNATGGRTDTFLEKAGEMTTKREQQSQGIG